MVDKIGLEKVSRQIERCLLRAASTQGYDFINRLTAKKGWPEGKIKEWIRSPGQAPLCGLVALAIELGVGGQLAAMLIPKVKNRSS